MFFLNQVILLCLCLFKLTQTTEFSNPEDSIVFELNSDLVIVNDHGSTYSIEAFTPSTNEQILKEKDSSKYDDLKWYSFGRPTILASENENPFHFSSKGFYIQVETLTESHKLLIIEELENKYQIEMDEDQVKNLVPTKFECRLEIECDSFFYLDGEVANTKEFPLKVNFHISKNSKEMKCLQSIVREEEDDFNFDCHLSSHLKQPSNEFSSLIGRSFTFNKNSIKSITSADKCLKQFERLNERVKKLEKAILLLLEEKSKTKLQSVDELPIEELTDSVTTQSNEE